MKNIDIRRLLNYPAQALNKFRRYSKLIFVLLVIAINGFLIFDINQLTNKEPSPEKISEQLQLIKRPKIDEETISKIKQLEDQNVGVQSLFKAARDNPFQD